jgi:hypothetical protein
MPITYVNTGTVVASSSGSPVTIPYPASIASGDLLIACGHQANSANTASAPSSTLTWTQQVERTVSHRLWSATYDGVASAPTFNSGSNNGTYFLMAFRGCDTSNPSVNSNSSTASLVDLTRFPALTVAVSNCAIITYCSYNRTITSVTAASGFTEVVDQNAPTGGGNCSIQAQYQIQSPGPNNISQTDMVIVGGPGSAQTSLGIIIAIRVASAPGGGSRLSLLGVG